MVFSSHISKKLSYHIVVDGIKLKSSLEAKNFAGKVAIGEVAKYIDFAVYKPTQQFRVLGSKKFGKKNKKSIDYGLCYNFSCSDPDELIKRSFVTYTDGCLEFSTLQDILDTKITAFKDGDCCEAGSICTRIILILSKYDSTGKVQMSVIWS